MSFPPNPGPRGALARAPRATERPLHRGSPFDQDSDADYLPWRDAKRERHPRHVRELVVNVADPRALTPEERQELLQRCASANISSGSRLPSM